VLKPVQFCFHFFPNRARTGRPLFLIPSSWIFIVPLDSRPFVFPTYDGVSIELLDAPYLVILFVAFSLDLLFSPEAAMLSDLLLQELVILPSDPFVLRLFMPAKPVFVIRKRSCASLIRICLLFGLCSSAFFSFSFFGCYLFIRSLDTGAGRAYLFFLL